MRTPERHRSRSPHAEGYRKSAAHRTARPT
ncbi:MAG: hypothetical protein HRU17_00170 [Polyangiaceae bacterium]|nr:hypothetical protein [Polyangiaceae bacterium]